MSQLLPEESESQEIGHRAVKAFIAQMPDSWRFQGLSGDTDAGIDAFIQIVADGRYSEAFHAQFKGSTVAACSADGSFVSVRMRVATINYYKRVGGSIINFARGATQHFAATDCVIRAESEKRSELLLGVPPGHVQANFGNNDLGGLLFDAGYFCQVYATDLG